MHILQTKPKNNERNAMTFLTFAKMENSNYFLKLSIAFSFALYDEEYENIRQ